VKTPEPATKISDSRSALQPSYSHASLDQSRVALGREYIVAVRGGVAVEEVDFLLFVLARMCFIGAPLA